MAQYEIKYNETLSSGELLNAIRLALEDYSDTLRNMSHDVQEGFEDESKVLATFSNLLQERSEDVRKAYICLSTIREDYQSAEALVYDQIINTDSRIENGGSNAEETLPDGGDDPNGSGEKIDGWEGTESAKPSNGDNGDNSIHDNSDSHEYRPFPPFIIRPADRWDGTDYIPKWKIYYYFENYQYIYTSIINVIESAGYISMRYIWKLIKELLDKKLNNINSGNSNEIQGQTNGKDCELPGSNDSSNTNSSAANTILDTSTDSISNVNTGAGSGTVSLSEQESGVNAHVGRGNSITGGENTSLSNNGFQSSWVITSDTKTKNKSKEEDSIGTNATGVLTTGMGKMQLSDEMEKGYEAKPPDDETAEIDDIEDDSQLFDTYIPITTGKISENGNMMATPLIGAASMAVGSAAGYAIDKKTNSSQPDDNEGQGDSFFVAAQRGDGFFAGNLKGEYIILATTLTLLFSGLSIAAGVRINKKKQKSDAPFKIGYGVSAVLVGGAIQERG